MSDAITSLKRYLRCGRRIQPPRRVTRTLEFKNRKPTHQLRKCLLTRVVASPLTFEYTRVYMNFRESETSSTLARVIMRESMKNTSASTRKPPGCERLHLFLSYSRTLRPSWCRITQENSCIRTRFFFLHSPPWRWSFNKPRPFNHFNASRPRS